MIKRNDHNDKNKQGNVNIKYIFFFVSVYFSIPLIANKHVKDQGIIQNIVNILSPPKRK
jgi:hypothetical protein